MGPTRQSTGSLGYTRSKIWTTGVFQGHKSFRDSSSENSLLAHSTEHLPLWSADEWEKNNFLYVCLGEENCIREIVLFFFSFFFLWMIFIFFFLFCYNEMSHLGSEGAGVKTSSLMSGSVICHEAVKSKQCSFQSALDFYNVVN